MILDNPRHEKFAQAIASGREQGRAYEESGFEARGKSADESASRLVKDSQVAARIAELKSQSAADCRITRKDYMDYLVNVMYTPAGQVDDEHALCQSYKHTESERSLKLPDKLKAAELLSKACGWNAPEKVEHSGSTDVVVVIGKPK